MENLQSSPQTLENPKTIKVTQSAKLLRGCPLRDYCRQNEWPRLSQFNNWIYTRHPIALACIKRVGGRYFVDIAALEEYVKNATLGVK